MYLMKAPAIQQGLAEASDNLKVSATDSLPAGSQRSMSDLDGGLTTLGILPVSNDAEQKKGVSLDSSGVSIKTNRRAPTREEYLVSTVPIRQGRV